MASPLVTAMVRGGACILDEGNRMSEKSWASLAPLLDHRRSVDSVIAGITMKNGYAPGGGGAMLIAGFSSLFVTNCVFEDNATGMTDWHAGGDAVAAIGTARADIGDEVADGGKRRRGETGRRGNPGGAGHDRF